MTERIIATGQDRNGLPAAVPLPKRTVPRGMLPSTWTGRKLRIASTDCYGSGQETSGVLLDVFPAGPVLNIRGARTLISGDRLAMIEVVAG